jgi:hypothetical protein
MAKSDDNDTYPEVFKESILLDPAVMADEAMITEAFRASEESIQAMGGTVLTHGIYSGLPMDLDVSKKEIDASKRAGYGTLQITYTSQTNAMHAQAP